MEMLLKYVLISTLGVLVLLAILLLKRSRNERQNKNLKIANKKLNELSAQKNEFLSFATHQLRSPLTSIKWGLNSIKEEYKEETVNHLILTVDDLISTVNDLLDISKIEQGGMVMKFEEFDLHDFIGRIVEEFRLTAENKGLKISFESENIPCFVFGDQNKIRQVFVNIIDNSIKYTQSGSIDVSFKKLGEMAKVSVSDTGPGISKEELENLFQKFLRGKAGKESLGGSGLGLYLAKKIIENHNGTIEAFSKGLGKGSEFVVMVPVKRNAN